MYLRTRRAKLRGGCTVEELAEREDAADLRLAVVVASPFEKNSLDDAANLRLAVATNDDECCRRDDDDTVDDDNNGGADVRGAGGGRVQ